MLLQTEVVKAAENVTTTAGYLMMLCTIILKNAHKLSRKCNNTLCTGHHRRTRDLNSFAVLRRFAVFFVTLRAFPFMVHPTTKRHVHALSDIALSPSNASSKISRLVVNPTVRPYDFPRWLDAFGFWPHTTWKFIYACTDSSRS
jgi:hypothetical protein